MTSLMTESITNPVAQLYAIYIMQVLFEFFELIATFSDRFPTNAELPIIFFEEIQGQAVILEKFTL